MTVPPTSRLRRDHVKMPAPRRRHWGVAALLILGLLFLFVGRPWGWLGPLFHKNLLNRYATQYRFDPLWVMSVVKVESGFSRWARSNRGAIGLMQLLPSTAKDIAPEIGITNFKADDLQDPEMNVRLGVYYLYKLEHMFPEDTTAILAAYNAGPGITQTWRRGKPALELEDIEYPETRRFVQNVGRTYHLLKTARDWKSRVGDWL